MAEGYKYEDIAAALISRIETGQYAPGDQLPSEADLRTEFGGVSANTVRKALQVLQEAGLTRPERARGVFVRSYQRATAPAPLGAGGHAIYPVEVTTMLAPSHVVDLMPGDVQVVRRTSTRHPHEKAYYPRRLIDAVPELGEPHELPVDDAALLAQAGLTVVSKTAEVIARMPTRQEMLTLDLSSGTPVLEVVAALTDNTGTVMAVREALYPGDRVKLHFDLR